MKDRYRKSIQKKAKKGFRGYPVGTIALYGPDNLKATKIAVGIIRSENEQEAEMKRWYSEENDIRQDQSISKEILEFLKENEVKSVSMVDGIIGCPHEEVKDYPEGEQCPQCLFWQNRDRFTHETIH